VTQNTWLKWLEGKVTRDWEAEQPTKEVATKLRRRLSNWDIFQKLFAFVLQFGATTKVGGWKTPSFLPQKDGKQRTRLATCWSATFVQLLLLIFFIVRLHLKYSAN